MIRPLGHLRDGPQGSATTAARPLAVREERTMTPTERVANGAAWLVSQQGTDAGFDIRRIDVATLNILSGMDCALAQAASGERGPTSYFRALALTPGAQTDGEYGEAAQRWAVEHGFMVEDYFADDIPWDDAVVMRERDGEALQAAWEALLTRTPAL